MSDDRTDEQREVSAMRATAHPVRIQILSLLTGAEMSAAEVARELDITHANASYHLRRLAEVDLIVEAGEEKIRGGVAKKYRHPWDERDRRPGSPDDVAAYVRAVADEMVRRFPLRRPAAAQHPLRRRDVGSRRRPGSGSATSSSRPPAWSTPRRSPRAPPAPSTST